MQGLTSLKTLFCLDKTRCILIFLWIQQNANFKFVVQETAGLVLTCKAPKPTCFTVPLPVAEGKYSLSGSVSTTVIAEQRKLLRNNTSGASNWRFGWAEWDFSAACLNSTENTLSFLEDTQRFTTTLVAVSPLQDKAGRLAREIPFSHSRESDTWGRAQTASAPMVSHAAQPETHCLALEPNQLFSTTRLYICQLQKCLYPVLWSC